MKLRKTLIIVFAFLIFLLTANAVNAGLGISPSRMTVKHLLRDSHYEKTFVLSRSDPKETVNFRVLVEGSIKDWITTDKGTEFTWPASQQRFPVTVIVEPPSDTPNGLYEGSIRFITVPKPEEELGGSTAVVVLAAAVQAKLTVTGEQVLEYTILAVTIKVVEEGLPIGIAITINNTGNVKARPTKVHVDIYDKFKEILLESHDITETEMGFVDAFKRDDIIIEIPNKLGIEQYWAVVSIYRDDVLLEEESVMFEIVEAGSLQRQGILKEIINEEEVELGEIVKITGVFENTGQTGLSAKLVLEIYKDGKLVDLIESELISVEQGKTESLTAYFKPTEEGKYIIKGHIAYSGKTTAAKESTFNVKAKAKDLVTSSIVALVIKALIIILCLIVGIVIFFRMKKKIKGKTTAFFQKPKKSITIEDEIVKVKEETPVKAEKTKKSRQKKTEETREKWFEPGGKKLTIDLYKVGEELVIQSTIAGVKPEDLEITIQGDIVTIKGVRIKPDEEPSKSYYYQECYWGPFSRQIVLPEEVDPSRMEASLQEGILIIRIPRIEKEKKRIIAIKREKDSR